MARWQKHVRLALGLFAVGFAVVLWFVIGERQPAAPAAAVELDPKAVSEIKGGDAIQVKGAKRDIRVEFAKQVSYEDNRTHYTTFRAHIDDRGGRSFVISGNEAWVGKDLSTYDVTGDVKLATSDGLTATTPRAAFTEAEGILKGEGPIEFQRQRVRGSGVGFSYDRTLDRLWLLDQAAINVAPANNAGGMQVRAGSAGYSRKERYMRFERGTRLERDAQVMEAQTATVFLRRDRDEAETIELRGNSSITGANGTSSLQGMKAGDINLKYGPDGRTLQQALLMRQANAQLRRPDGSTGQQLTAEFIDAALAPDGAVTQLIGRDNVRTTLPATADASARSVTAPLLNAAGEAGKGLTTMSFDNGVEYREDASKETSGRVAKAQRLQAAMAANGTIEQATFTEAFRFEDGKLAATGASAVYNVVKGTLALRGSGSGTPPNITDERVALNAQTIDLTLSPRQMTASGRVSAQFAAGRREGERGTTLFSEKEALVVTAEKFAFDESSGSTSFSGKQAVLWQEAGGSSIRGDSIVLNNKTGTLTATGNVVTALPIAGRTDERSKGMSLARAGEFHFDDAKRRALFIKQAQFDGAQGNLKADRIELTLAAKDNTLENLVAEGAVNAVVDKRWATGQKLTYYPSEEKYVISGTTVRLVVRLDDGTCQESVGRTLTFYRGSERVLADGNQEIRVQTKGGSKCSDAPPQ